MAPRWLELIPHLLSPENLASRFRENDFPGRPRPLSYPRSLSQVLSELSLPLAFTATLTLRIHRNSSADRLQSKEGSKDAITYQIELGLKRVEKFMEACTNDIVNLRVR